jgi:hypothetical protein
MPLIDLDSVVKVDEVGTGNLCFCASSVTDARAPLSTVAGKPDSFADNGPSPGLDDACWTASAHAATILRELHKVEWPWRRQLAAYCENLQHGTYGSRRADVRLLAKQPYSRRWFCRDVRLRTSDSSSRRGISAGCAIHGLM